MENGSSDILRQVRKIEIKTRGLSNDIFAGHYHSAFKGRGMAFSEVREYRIGDDVRDIDWNVTARSRNPHIKVYEEERELTMMLLVDVSGSRMFGTAEKIKKNIITEIAAVLAFSAAENNDKVGCIFFSDRIEKFIPPKKGRSHILMIIRELIEFQPAGRGTALSEPLRYLTNAIKKRCTAFLLSDFMVPEEDRKEAVKKSCQRCFQALRIDVNNEFESLYAFLEKLPMVLKPSGRVAILTFHSGEDRLVKKAFKECFREGLYSEIARDVIRPSAEECIRNSRAHSTKMRWAIRAEE